MLHPESHLEPQQLTYLVELMNETEKVQQEPSLYSARARDESVGGGGGRCDDCVSPWRWTSPPSHVSQQGTELGVQWSPAGRSLSVRARARVHTHTRTHFIHLTFQKCWCFSVETKILSISIYFFDIFNLWFQWILTFSWLINQFLICSGTKPPLLCRRNERQT